jgi:hypothetical protein
MSLWRDEKYLHLLSSQLSRFSSKGHHTFNFRCPICGDSETNKHKARGYCFAKGDILIFKCHNCALAIPFAALLRRLDRFHYDEYVMEAMAEERQTSSAAPSLQTAPVTAPAPAPARPETPDGVSPLSAPTLAIAPVVAFMRERKVPEAVFPRLFGTLSANRWLTLRVGEEKAAKVCDGQPYLVQPLRLPDGTWYGAQLRMIARKEYFTFRWSHDPLKVFGFEAWDPKKTVYITEGPIDSLFIPNAISTCGSDLLSGIQLAIDQGVMSLTAPRVYVWDNEPRNKEIVRHIRTAVQTHESVVIWPREYPKDINDMVRAGIDVNTVIKRRTFQGLRAELEFASWLKS